MASNVCPYPTCEDNVHTGQYACREHWFALPKVIRDKIYDGYKTSIRKWQAADKEAREYYENMEKSKKMFAEMKNGKK